jgi:hypothetical protein
MLIDFIGQLTRPCSESHPLSSPIVGSPTDSMPTSGDVHLYVDPMSRSSGRLTLYADSEGFTVSKFLHGAHD